MTYPRDTRGDDISEATKRLVYALAFQLVDGPTPQHGMLKRQLAGAWR